VREDHLYMDEGGGEEMLLGDYVHNGFSIRVEDLSFNDNYPTINTVDVSFNLKLQDLSTDPATTLETMNFGAQVQPRNRL
jgi:hypothetical protein